MELSGKTVLVTGGAVRVGRAIALALSGAGARVVVHYNASADPAFELVERIRSAGGVAAAVRADLRLPGEVERLAEAAEAELGDIDVLVNSASVFPKARFDEVDVELWDETIGVNLRAPFFLTQKVGGRMKSRGEGVVVNLVDLAGLQSWSNYAVHAISKAGLLHLTRIAARALAPEVRVVAIAPGTVLPPTDLTAEQVQRLADRAPLGRIGSPDDISNAVLYLIGADFVTGEVLVVDGGRLLR